MCISIPEVSKYIAIHPQLYEAIIEYFISNNSWILHTDCKII